MGMYIQLSEKFRFTHCGRLGELHLKACILERGHASSVFAVQHFVCKGQVVTW